MDSVKILNAVFKVTHILLRLKSYSEFVFNSVSFIIFKIIIFSTSFDCYCTGCSKALFTHSRFSLRFTTIHPDFSWSEKSGWTGMNRGEKWKYSMSLRFQ